MLGALECILPNGKRFDVGSGFNMDQRRKPPKIGSVITFKFQELSNNGIPRFPVFLRIRSDLTWNDVLEAAKTKQPVSLKKKVVPSTKLSKQHSILFSVIPSRDGKTGKKVVTADDVDENAAEVAPLPSSSKGKTTTQEVCPYGAKCYRTNPDHLKEYEHPPRATKSKSTTSKTSSNTSVRSPANRSKTRQSTKKAKQEDVDDSEELPSTTDNLLVNDKNKGRRLDNDEEGEEEEEASNVRQRATKRRRNLEEKPAINSGRKRVKKT